MQIEQVSSHLAPVSSEIWSNFLRKALLSI